MAISLPVYLDYASTTPIDERALNKMLPYFNKHYGNASSKTHAYGWISEEAVQIAREEIAALINSSTEEIVFTSGATESVNLALRGITENASQKKHIISFKTEHRAVIDTLSVLEKKGFNISLLPVDENGQINIDDVSSHIQHDTLMIACMYANNETGVIHPIKEIGGIAKEKCVFFFCDATQAVGKIPVNVEADGIDMMAFSAHKIYGPKGTGALYIRRKNPRISLAPQITGGGQEKDIRSGTLNVPGIVGLGEAARLCREEMNKESKRILTLRNQLESVLIEKHSAAIHGMNTKRLPNISNIYLPQYNGSNLIADLCTRLAVSAGSACSSGEQGGSHVLRAMGISADEIKKTVRISLGRMTKEEDLIRTIDVIGMICKGSW
jgi:cysteine desulfurase